MGSVEEEEEEEASLRTKRGRAKRRAGSAVQRRQQAERDRLTKRRSLTFAAFNILIEEISCSWNSYTLKVVS